MRYLVGTRAQLAPVWRAYGIQPQGQGYEHTASTVIVDGDGPAARRLPDGPAHARGAGGRSPRALRRRSRSALNAERAAEQQGRRRVHERDEPVAGVGEHEHGPKATLAAAMRPPADFDVLAPPFPRQAEWVNVATLRMDQQRGRPVLVEFWDFCRVNSLRTLPYLKAWHERYADAGLRVDRDPQRRLRALARSRRGARRGRAAGDRVSRC